MKCYVFTGVCLSTGGEGYLPHWVLGPEADTPTPRDQRQTPPWADTPRANSPPLGGHPPGTRGRPPTGRHPPGQTRPSAQCTLGYGHQAGFTHPTGMHSCPDIFYLIFFSRMEIITCISTIWRTLRSSGSLSKGS